MSATRGRGAPSIAAVSELPSSKLDATTALATAPTTTTTTSATSHRRLLLANIAAAPEARAGGAMRLVRPVGRRIRLAGAGRPPLRVDPAVVRVTDERDCLVITRPVGH